MPSKKKSQSKHNLPPDLRQDFEEQIEVYGLSEFRAELMEIARPKLTVFYKDKILKRIPKGISRIGGPPDVTSIDQWRCPKNGVYNVFYFQINLADIPGPSDFNLPSSGLMSLYVSNQNMVNDDATIFVNKRTDNLKRFPLPELTEYCDGDLRKNHLPACARPPRKLKIERGVWLPEQFPPLSIRESGYENEDAYHELSFHYDGMIDLCAHSNQMCFNTKGWTCLFKLHGCDYFEFGDCGYEYIWVRNTKGKLDFSKTRAEYSDF